MRVPLLTLSAAFVLATIVALAPVHAQVPQTMSYQGVLTDNVGNLVPDGDYDLTFRIYNVAVAGAALSTEVHPDVPVVNGGFAVVLGSITPLTLPFDVPYFLSVQVFGDPELAPRTPLTSSPYALSLRLPFSRTHSSTPPLLQLSNSGSGSEVALGSSTNDGRLDWFRNGSASAIGTLSSGSQGGRIGLNDEAGNILGAIEPDINGTGGFIYLARSTTQTGFTVDGNNGSGDAVLSLLGGSRSVVLNTGSAGDASVQLPASSISATEALDEPGCASINASGSIALTGAVDILLSRSITVPVDGYVLVLGSVQTSLVHTNGAQSSVAIGVSDDAAALPTTQAMNFTLSLSVASGSYIVNQSPHGLFAVTAGSHTFYLLGDENGGSCNVGERQLTLLFIPTEYGTVTPTLPGGIAGSGPEYGPPLAPAALADERRTSIAANDARIAREMAAMQRQLQQLEAELQRLRDAQRAGMSESR